MTILPRPAHPAPPRFSLLYKDGGVGMGKYFVPAPWGRDGFSIFIPNPSCPIPSPPCTNKDYYCKFSKL